MSDSDDYDESSDEDYVPFAEDVSEEEESGEDEDLPATEDAHGNAENGTVKSKKGKSKAKKSATKRQRKGGIKLDGEESEENNDDNEERKKKEEEDKRISAEIEKEVESIKEEEEKKKIDDLWSSFLSDVKQKPKSAVSSSSQSSGSLASLTKPVSATATKSSAVSSPVTEKKPEKVTITKVFDFAGEEVRVTKEVAADSKEAKQAAKEEKKMEEAETAKPAATSGLAGVKRSAGGLGSVLGKIGKKSKISVLPETDVEENLNVAGQKSPIHSIAISERTVEGIDKATYSESGYNLDSSAAVNVDEMKSNRRESDKATHSTDLVSDDRCQEQSSRTRHKNFTEVDSSKTRGRFACQSNCDGPCMCFSPRRSRGPYSPQRPRDALDEFLASRQKDSESDEEPSLNIRAILNLT